MSALWPEVEQPALLVWGTKPGFSSFVDAEDFILERSEAELPPNKYPDREFNRSLLGLLERIGW